MNTSPVRFTAAAVLCVLGLAQAAVNAQPAQPPASTASAPPRGAGPGPGTRGPPDGAAGPRSRWGQSFTPGWSMMTPQEREEHRAQMRGARSQDECRKVADEHRALMQKRAQERGVKMPGPRSDACRGFRS